MDALDKIIAAGTQVTTNVLDAWGRVRVAQLDAQVQPPAPAPAMEMPVFNTATMLPMLLLGAVTVGAVIWIAKK